MFGGEPLSCARKTGLHLVGDKENAVLAANVLQQLEVIARRDDEAAFTENGLNDQGGNGFSRYGALEGVLEGLVDLVGPGLGICSRSRRQHGEMRAVVIARMFLVDLDRSKRNADAHVALIDVAPLGALIADRGVSCTITGRKQNAAHRHVGSIAEVVCNRCGTFITEFQVLRLRPGARGVAGDLDHVVLYRGCIRRQLA